MSFDLITNNETCFVLSQTLPLSLVYYSHIPTTIIPLLLSLFVFIRNRGLASKILLVIGVVFSLWSVFDLVTWTSFDTRKTMLSWSLLGLTYDLIYVLSLYFWYVFVDKKDISFRMKIVFGVLLFPVLFLTPTIFNLEGFRVASCEAIEGFWFTNYYHLLGRVVLLWIFVLAIHRYRRVIGHEEKQQIFLFSLGIELFLAAFFLAGYISSLLDNFLILIYGLFGMPIFMGFLAYLIVRYQAFNIKVIATQALVVTLAVLIGSQLFFIKSQTNFVLTSLTFLLSIVFGIFLIRSVKNEIRRKEELQVVTDKLAAANVELKRLDQSKTEFISIASHQLRTPLTAIKGFVSLLLEGSYGTVPAPIADVLDKIYTANDRIVHLVEDLLNISRMESGRLKYEYAEVNIPEFLNELRDTFALVAKKKGLDLTFEVPAGALAPAWIDRQKAFEVVSNLIDNAIKYTSAGSVRVRAESVLGFVCISVADTGVGIDPDMMPVLFQKFSRGKESGKMHVSGTGLGLYVGKSMIEAQGGHIGVTSEGAGKGSTFFVELPVKQG